MKGLLEKPTQVDVIDFYYEPGSSYMTTHASGNPRITNPSILQLTVKSEKVSKTEFQVDIKGFKKSLTEETNKKRTAKQGPLKIVRMTQNRLSIIKNTMPNKVTVENNPEYYNMKNLDTFAYPITITEKDMKDWVDKIVNHPDWS